MKLTTFNLRTWALLPLFIVFVFASCSEKEDEPYLKSADNGATITADGNAWSGWSTILQSNIDLKPFCYGKRLSTSSLCRRQPFTI